MSRLQDFQLVMFDLDGTLLESVAEMSAAIGDAMADLGLAAPAQHLVRGWIGHGTRDLLNRVAEWARAHGTDEVDEEALGARYDVRYLQRCGTDSQLYPGVREALSALGARGVKLAVVTNKEARFVQPLLAAHGVGEVFDLVVCGDTCQRRKPDPTGVRLCLDRFQVLPERALFVGDSAVDVETARRAGVTVWVVPHGYNAGEPVAHSQPDRLLAGFHEFLV